MKISFLSGLGPWCGQNKIKAWIIGVILLGALGYGGWFGWQEYQYRQTAVYAIEKIKAALNPADPEKLAHLVNFNSLTGDLARNIRNVFPFCMEGADQEREIRQSLQSGLLAKILTSAEKSPPLPEKEEERMKMDARILPTDFITQILNTLHLVDSRGGSALASAKLHYPLLDKTFTLVFDMRKGPDGWEVTRFANSKELVEQFRSAMLERHARIRGFYEKKNAGTLKVMNDMLPIQSCTAHAGLLSDRKTLVMIVHVIARNRGTFQINNFNLDTGIFGSGGQLILRRNLNAAKAVKAGEDFNHRWSFEMEGSSDIGRALLANGPLQCRASWQTLGASDGKVLHIVEVPNKNVPCGIANHDHPEGFCLLPVFRKE